MGENIKSQTNHNEGQPIHYLQPLIVMDSDIKVHCMLISMFNCPGWWKNNSNRRCCQFKTPPTTGQNLHFFFFYPHYIGESVKLFSKKLSHVIRPRNLVVILFILHTLAHKMRTFLTVFLQTALLISSIVRVKNQDLVQSLVAFGSSNICYSIITSICASRYMNCKQISKSKLIRHVFLNFFNLWWISPWSLPKSVCHK